MELLGWLGNNIFVKDTTLDIMLDSHVSALQQQEIEIRQDQT